MKVILNQTELCVDNNLTLCNLLKEQNIKPEGIAVAINNKIISKSDWAETTLCESDKITVIQATYGG